MNFKIGDKVSVIPWEQAKETNLYNSVENEVYGIEEVRWFESGRVVGFVRDSKYLLVSDDVETWWQLPVEFLTLSPGVFIFEENVCLL